VPEEEKRMLVGKLLKNKKNNAIRLIDLKISVKIKIQAF
jgi:hypothetical protein